MPRPQTKDSDRLDTKVRLARRHEQAIKAYEAEHGPGQRNSIIERGLDLFFGLQPAIRPRLTSPDPGGMIGGESKANTRVRPGLTHATSEQVEAAGKGKDVPPPSKGRARPRSRP